MTSSAVAQLELITGDVLDRSQTKHHYNLIINQNFVTGYDFNLTMYKRWFCDD